MIASDHPICLVADDADIPLPVAGDAAWRIRTIRSLEEIHTELSALVERAPTGTRMLDVIGHSTRDHHLLRIGATAIDMFRPAVAQLFESIGRDALLPRLGITAVRLLGCSTAVFPSGQRTMRRLARTLDVPVYGSTKDLLRWHYRADGFNPQFAHVLVEASQLPNPPRRLTPT